MLIAAPHEKPEPALGMKKGIVDRADLEQAVREALRVHGLPCADCGEPAERARSGTANSSRSGSRLGPCAPVFPVGRWATVTLRVALPDVTLAVDQDVPFTYSMTPLPPGTFLELEIGPSRAAGGTEIDVGFDNIAVRSR